MFEIYSNAESQDQYFILLEHLASSIKSTTWDKYYQLEVLKLCRLWFGSEGYSYFKFSQRFKLNMRFETDHI